MAVTALIISALGLLVAMPGSALAILGLRDRRRAVAEREPEPAARASFRRRVVNFGPRLRSWGAAMYFPDEGHESTFDAARELLHLMISRATSTPKVDRQAFIAAR